MKKTDKIGECEENTQEIEREENTEEIEAEENRQKIEREENQGKIERCEPTEENKESCGSSSVGVNLDTHDATYDFQGVKVHVKSNVDDAVVHCIDEFECQVVCRVSVLLGAF